MADGGGRKRAASENDTMEAENSDKRARMGPAMFDALLGEKTVTMDIRSLDDGQKVLLRAIKDMQDYFEKRLDNLEDSLESKVRFIVTEQLEPVKKDFIEKSEAIKERVALLKNGRGQVSGDISLNFVIRNLPEGVNENIENKVNALLREGLKLRDIAVSEVQRKQSYNLAVLL